jgi:hypothetical protein
MNQQEYNNFEKLNDGYIASFFFLQELTKLITERHPKRILEVGVGMGTIPYSVREFKDTFEYVGTEMLVFCIDRLKINAPFVHLFKDVSEIGGKFDLIIVDGRDKDTNKLPSMLNEKGLLLVENDRRGQVEIIQNSTNRRYVNYRKRPFSLHKAAGYTVFIFEPGLLDYVRFVIGWASYKIKTHTAFWINRLLRCFGLKQQQPSA